MQRSPSRAAFTLIEMITVIAIIAILAGLILSISGLVQQKGARAKAESEIQALSGALESYKTDFGGYPQSPETDALDARLTGSTLSYTKQSKLLYTALSGDDNANGKIDAGEKANNYAPDFFRPSRFDTGYKSSGNVTYIVDPFGYSYGYSTAGLSVEQDYQERLSKDANANRSGSTKGYNPTFDLWSTAGTNSGSETDRGKWIKNW